MIDWAKSNRWWLGLCTFYLIVAAVLVFGFDIIMTDAISRVANSSYVFRGREPHLAAIGFVWTPGPSLMIVPFVPFAKIFPFLLTKGFAANITSAIAMTGAARQMFLLARRIGLSDRATLFVTVGFALHPMVLFYAANGMSESMSTFGLLLAVNALLGWLQEGVTVKLVVCGLGIATAYLARYEAGLAFLGAASVVTVVSWQRARRGYIPPMSAMRLSRPGTTSAAGAPAPWIVLNELLLLAIPAAVAFFGWAFVSWMVTGHPFEQLSSEYGIKEFVKAYKTEGSIGGTTADVIRTFGILQPLFMGFLGIGIVASIVRRRIELLVCAAIFVPVLGFTVWAVTTGEALFLYRYLFAVLPLCAVAVAISVRALSDIKLFHRSQGAPGAADQFVRLFQFLPVALLLLTFPFAAAKLVHEERSVRSFNAYQLDEDVAHYVDSLNAKRGSILTDSGTAFAVLLRSKHPERFVMTSDSDFRERVANLSTVTYILVPENTGLLKLDAVNKRWPNMFASGPSQNSLVREWKAVDGRPHWRLFQVATPVTG